MIAASSFALLSFGTLSEKVFPYKTQFIHTKWSNSSESYCEMHENLYANFLQYFVTCLDNLELVTCLDNVTISPL